MLYDIEAADKEMKKKEEQDKNHISQELATLADVQRKATDLIAEIERAIFPFKPDELQLSP